MNITSKQELQSISQFFKGKDRKIVALGSKILCVAVEGTVDDWSAYIGTINDSWDEWVLIAYKGTKLQQRIAKAIFPHFAKKYKWRA